MARKKKKDPAVQNFGQNCKLCNQYQILGTNNRFRCCKTCRSVTVKVKNIRPMVAEIKNMLKEHKRQKKSNLRYQKEEKVVTDVQLEDAFAMPNADPDDGRKINLAASCYMRINVPCAYYPHDVHTTTPQMLQKYFNVELSILFKLGHSSNSPDSVMCTACSAMFLTDGKTISQSVLENHVSEIHVPNSTARDYRFVCIMCDGTVYDLLGVKRHMVDKHSSLLSKDETNDTETYACQICKENNKNKSRLYSDKSQLFASKAELQMHIDLAHPGNFTCTECKTSLVFNTAEMLNMHMNAYHPEVG